MQQAGIPKAAMPPPPLSALASPEVYVLKAPVLKLLIDTLVDVAGCVYFSIVGETVHLQCKAIGGMMREGCSSCLRIEAASAFRRTNLVNKHLEGNVGIDFVGPLHRLVQPRQRLLVLVLSGSELGRVRGREMASRLHSLKRRGDTAHLGVDDKDKGTTASENEL
jgi:hypothetical protein